MARRAFGYIKVGKPVSRLEIIEDEFEASGLRIGRKGDRLKKFEESLERLEQILKELERGDIPLERSLQLFEEGMKLSAACRKELDEAEGRIEILVKQTGKSEPYEASAERAEAKKG